MRFPPLRFLGLSSVADDEDDIEATGDVEVAGVTGTEMDATLRAPAFAFLVSWEASSVRVNSDIL